MQSDTPLGQVWLAERQGWSEQDKAREAAQLFDLTTRMYALARIMLGDVNIAATTALQVGREHPTAWGGQGQCCRSSKQLRADHLLLLLSGG